MLQLAWQETLWRENLHNSGYVTADLPVRPGAAASLKRSRIRASTALGTSQARLWEAETDDTIQGSHIGTLGPEQFWAAAGLLHRAPIRDHCGFHSWMGERAGVENGNGTRRPERADS